MKQVKSDFLLVSKLLMACQTRELNQEALLSHENSTYPPALSSDGNLNLPESKSDILQKLDAGLVSVADKPNFVDVHIFDGPGVMYSLKGQVTSSNTFGEFKSDVFLPWLSNQLQYCNRVDFVWDRYPIDSLKSYTRNERGRGRRKHVGDNIKIPAKMIDFLKNGENKEDLFQFLSKGVEQIEITAGKQVWITYNDTVIRKGSTLDFGSCDHDESDTRTMVHLTHAVQNGCKKLVLSTVDSDVVVLSIYAFSVLRQEYPDLQFWVIVGPPKKQSVYHIGQIFENLGEQKCKALPFFTAFTGCDTTSQFVNKGKLSA